MRTRRIATSLVYTLLFTLAARIAWKSLSSPIPISTNNKIDYSWGSIQYHLHNHPTHAVARSVLPSTSTETRNSDIIRIWVVTSELEGLNQNGGIGTAFKELALELADQQSFLVSILIAHPRLSYTARQLDALHLELAPHNITLHFLEFSKIPIYPVGWTAHASIGIYRYLRKHQSTIDIIHFSENAGIGYFTALSKFQGLAFQKSRIIVGLHGAEVEWSALLNKAYPSDRYRVELGYFEQRTAELSDIVISPSDYMVEYVRRRGWKLPQATFVIPNIINSPKLKEKVQKNERIRELVFFGRLEERKGIKLFIQALEILLTDESTPKIDVITFLGRDHADQKTHTLASALLTASLVKLQEYSIHPFTFDFKKDLGRAAALNYLKNSTRLAVVPALADNSPSTIIECIIFNIRFIASNVGGIPELILPEDHSKVLFSPRPSSLVRHISKALTTFPSVIRQSPATISAARDWVSLHRYAFSLNLPPPPSSARPLVTIIITHFERPELVVQLLDSLRRQEYTNFELILIDDGSEQEESILLLDQLEIDFKSRAGWQLIRIENSYLGEARNVGAAISTGEFLLFLDDDDVLKPHALETLVKVALRTTASALSSWLDEFASDENPMKLDDFIPHRRTYYFSGQSIGLGVIDNCFGSGNIFIKREVFERLGGFTELREIGGEDWEFWMKVALGGYSQYVVPEELIYVRSDPRSSSMKYTMDPWHAGYRALTPLLNDARVQDLGLAHAVMLLKGSLSKSTTPRPFADSKSDFQLIQGWNGWQYYFATEELNPEEAVAGESQWSNERNRYLPPYITETSQHPFVSATGRSTVAIRRFRSPKSMDVSIRLDYSATHQCGDGTELQLVYQSTVGNPFISLFIRNTMETGREEFQMEFHLKKGSTLSLISRPLTTSDCDNIDVQLLIIATAPGNLAWSSIAKKEQESIRQEISTVPDDTQMWTAVVEPIVDPDTQFHLVLIFDQNRFEHAKQVIRSAIHFLKSRTLHFHLLAPLHLHRQIHQDFDSFTTVIHTYDHNFCHQYASEILPFSSPEIHISAQCKLFLSEILSTVDRALYLDTDTTIVSDLSDCYSKPLLPKTLISMAVDGGDSCQLFPDLCWPIGMNWTPLNGSMETFQVNGGVILMELAKMREEHFVASYVQSIVHHYRAVGAIANWGEQDFINSYFRLFPHQLEVLPCGCNYQWFSARREIKCGGFPVRIAHAWSHGIATRSSAPFNRLFHHFLDNVAESAIPSFDLLSPAGEFSEQSISIDFNSNCPLQSHDCSSAFEMRPYGDLVTIISRTGAAFSEDLVDSIDSQIYPYITHFVSKPAALNLRTTDIYRYELDSNWTPREPESCNRALGDQQAFQQCLCRSFDSGAADINHLESLAQTGWILYLNDDRLFTAPESLAHLMAQLDNRDQLLVFRSNSSTHDEVRWHGKKLLGRNELDSVGFIFHSSHLDLASVSDRRCGISRTYESLSKRLSIKWIDLVPTITHPLLRHLPRRDFHDLKITVFLFETMSRPSWLISALEALTDPSFETLVAEIIVVSTDREPGSLGDEIHVLNLTPGLGLMELAGISSTDGVLLLSDSIFLSKIALTALINQWLENPTRILGPFTLTNPFAAPLQQDPELFDYFGEPDTFVGQQSYIGISTRLLLTNSSNFDQLTRLLDESYLHPICHSVLLNQLSKSQSPLRILLPENSLVDRVNDCRMRNWSDVTYDIIYGDEAADEDEVPTYLECVDSIKENFGLVAVESEKIGMTGTLGMFESARYGGDVTAEEWRGMRKEEKCLRD